MNSERQKLVALEARLLRMYGITLAQREAMLKRQGGACKICRRPQGIDRKSLHVDHCHKTGRVRGLLCQICNGYMGKIDRDPRILKRLIAYKESIQ